MSSVTLKSLALSYQKIDGRSFFWSDTTLKTAQSLKVRGSSSKEGVTPKVGQSSFSMTKAFRLRLNDNIWFILGVRPWYDLEHRSGWVTGVTEPHVVFAAHNALSRKQEGITWCSLTWRLPCKYIARMLPPVREPLLESTARLLFLRGREKAIYK